MGRQIARRIEAEPRPNIVGIVLARSTRNKGKNETWHWTPKYWQLRDNYGVIRAIKHEDVLGWVRDDGVVVMKGPKE